MAKREFCDASCREGWLTDRRYGMIYPPVRFPDGSLVGWRQAMRAEGSCPYCRRSVSSGKGFYSDRGLARKAKGLPMGRPRTNPLSARDRSEFRGYLRNCTDRQVQGVYDKEMDAGRRAYAELAVEEAERRGIYLERRNPRFSARQTRILRRVSRHGGSFGLASKIARTSKRNPGVIQRLRAEAYRAAKARGHDISWDAVYHSKWLRPGKRSVDGFCRKCGAHVGVDEDPPRNGVHIGGPAVAVACPGKRR